MTNGERLNKKARTQDLSLSISLIAKVERRMTKGERKWQKTKPHGLKEEEKEFVV